MRISNPSGPQPPGSHRARIASNVLIMSAGQVLTWVLSFGYFVIIGRYLGPDDFGELMLARSLVLVIWLLSTLGMETFVTRAIAREPGRAGSITSAAVIARVSLGLPLIVVVLVVMRFAHLNPDVAAATLFFGIAETLWSLQRVLVAAYQGRERMALGVAWSLSRNLLELALAAVVIWRQGPVYAFAAIDIPIAVALAVPTLVWMRQIGRLTYRVATQDLRDVVVGGLAFWANDVFFTVYLYIDSIMLAALAGTVAVGIYTPATKLFSVTMFLTGIIGPATLPHLSRLGVDRGEEFRNAARKVLSLFLVAGVPITIALATFSVPLIVTVFGPAYRESAPVLVVVSLAIVPMFLNFQFSQILAASDRQWWWAAALAGSCVLNPILNLILIPLGQQQWKNAAVGAALAWLLTELVEVAYGFILLADIVWSRVLARCAIGVGIAGILQAATIWLVGAFWLPLAEGVALAVFAGVAVASGAIPWDDVRLVRETLLQQMRGRTMRPGVVIAD